MSACHPSTPLTRTPFGRADAAALAAGGTTVYEPSQREWNAFAAEVADPDGHRWMILMPPDDWTD